MMRLFRQWYSGLNDRVVAKNLVVIASDRLRAGLEGTSHASQLQETGRKPHRVINVGDLVVRDSFCGGWPRGRAAEHRVDRRGRSGRE